MSSSRSGRQRPAARPRPARVRKHALEDGRQGPTIRRRTSYQRRAVLDAGLGTRGCRKLFSASKPRRRHTRLLHRVRSGPGCGRHRDANGLVDAHYPPILVPRELGGETIRSSTRPSSRGVGKQDELMLGRGEIVSYPVASDAFPARRARNAGARTHADGARVRERRNQHGLSRVGAHASQHADDKGWNGTLREHGLPLVRAFINPAGRRGSGSALAGPPELSQQIR